MHTLDPKLTKVTRFSYISAVGDGMHIELASEPDGARPADFAGLTSFNSLHTRASPAELPSLAEWILRRHLPPV